MRDSDIRDIRQLDLFRDMPEDSFQQLVRGAYVQTFPPQVELITEGDPCDFLHVIMDGCVELYAEWNRRDTTMSFVRPISSFILAAAVKDAPQLMSARTLEKSRILLLPAEDVRDVFEQDHIFARAVVTELAQCYRGVIKNTKTLKLRSSIERLANYICRKLEEKGSGTTLTLDVEKRRLASYLGMTPENLSRAIKALVPYGVDIVGQNITVSDLEALNTLAKPSPLIDDPNQ